MKKFENIAGKQMRAALLAAVALMLCGWMASCSNGLKTEKEALLHTVPADASAVICGDADKITEELGADQDKFRAIAESAVSGLNLKEPLTAALSRYDGAFVAFSHKGDSYITGTLTDVAAFKKSIDESDKGEWVKTGDVEIKGNYALVGDRMWEGANLTADKISGFMSLSEAQSFLSCEYSSKMAASDEALNFWLSIDNMLSGLSFSEQSQAKIGLSMLFDSPKFVIGNADFDKDGIEGSAMLVTDAYKPAKCVIDLARIDTNKVASLEGNANMIMALAVSGKFIEQLQQLGSSMGGALPAQMWNMISPLNGTMAIAMQGTPDNMNKDGNGFRAVISTDGKNNAALGQILGSMAEMKIDGDDFRLSKGRYGEGALNVAEIAKEMKDSWLGIAVAKKEGKNNYTSLMLLQPADGSLRIRFELKWQQ